MTIASTNNRKQLHNNLFTAAAFDTHFLRQQPFTRPDLKKHIKGLDLNGVKNKLWVEN